MSIASRLGADALRSKHIPLWRKAQEVYQLSRFGRGREREGVDHIKVKDVIHGFECTHKTPIPELEITQLIFRHRETGALGVHIDAADIDNCFA